MRRPPPRSTLFPYTTLFRSMRAWREQRHLFAARTEMLAHHLLVGLEAAAGQDHGVRRKRIAVRQLNAAQDRKSTRLNSSHSQISYAVFCLKKKTQKVYKSLE